MRAAGNFALWWKTARPKTLFAGVSPVVLGSALAFRAGGFRPDAAAVAAVCTLLLQAGANYVNDYFDFRHGHDTDRRTGPRRTAASGLVAPSRFLMAIGTLFFAALCAGVYLVVIGGRPVFFIGIAALVTSVIYTAGPVRLGASGFGEAAAFLFFGPVAGMGTYYLHTGSVTPASLLLSVCPGFFAVALLTVNNYRDSEEDRRTRKKTLAVRLGPRFARVLYIGTITAPALFFLLIPGLPGFGAGRAAGGSAAAVWPFGLPLLLAACGIPLWFPMVRRTPGPWLNRTLALTGLFQALFTLCAGIVLILA